MQEFFFSYIEQWSYLGLFLVLFIAGMGVPLPEDVPLIASGWLVHHTNGHVRLDLMILVGLIGVLAGDSIMFTMGRRYGDHLVGHRWLQWIAKPWLVAKAREQFEKHGEKIIFAARFMPGIRSVVFLTAGTFRVPYWKFWTFDGVAALISVPLWVWCGKYFGGHIESLLGGAKMATYLVVTAALVFVALFIWVEHRRIKRKNALIASEFASGKVNAISDVPGTLVDRVEALPKGEPRRRAEPAPIARPGAET